MLCATAADAGARNLLILPGRAISPSMYPSKVRSTPVTDSPRQGPYLTSRLKGDPVDFPSTWACDGADCHVTFDLQEVESVVQLRIGEEHSPQISRVGVSFAGHPRVVIVGSWGRFFEMSVESVEGPSNHHTALSKLSSWGTPQSMNKKHENVFSDESTERLVTPRNYFLLSFD